jgi:hypothetical protein
MSAGCSNTCFFSTGSHVLRVHSNIEICALAPDLFIINFRLPYTLDLDDVGCGKDGKTYPVVPVMVPRLEKAI